MQIHYGDCLDVLATLPDGCADAVIADPPYGTTACAWDTVIPFDPLWAQLRRVAKPSAAIALFASQPFTSALIMSNLREFRHEWVWRKPQGTGYLNARRAPMKNHEVVVVFSRRTALFNPQMREGAAYRTTRRAVGGFVRDKTVGGYVTISTGARYPLTVLDYSAERGLHPTQKPVDLLAYLVRTYTNPGETVLDFCMGSGTTAIACLNTRRDFIGIENDADHFTTAERRIAGAIAAIAERRKVSP